MGNTYTNKRGSSFFEETSQKIWGELQGNSQTDQEYTANFYGIDQNEKVDINKLVDFIKRGSFIYMPSFNWEHYVSNATKSIKEDNYYAAKGLLFSDIGIPVNVNWIYSENGYAPGNRVESKFNVKLNKRKNDFIELKDWGLSKNFNSNSKKYEFTLSFPFKNTKDNRINESENGNTFDIDERYVAVQFKTDNLKDLFYLFKELQIDTAEYLAKVVYGYIEKEENSEALAALYTQLPEELIVIMSSLDKDREFLKDHLEKLKKYDENSIFKDSSLAILNLFRIIKDIKYIYEILKKNPKTVLQLYYNMDGSSTFLGEEKSNKLFFAEMMQGIYLVNNLDALLNSDDSNINIVKEFKINDEYKIDSKISDNGDSGLIYLQQQRIVNVQGGGELVPGTPMPEGTMLQSIGNASYLSPFDLVTLERVENGKVTISKIPAIMLKAVVDQEVKAEMIQSIRVGITVAALIIGVATLGTASGPLAQTLALADIVLSAADLAILANEDQLLQTPEGKLFLETYNNVMLTASVLVAPFAIVGLAKMGLKLLKNAGQTTQKIVRSCMLKIVVEKNIITFEKQATFLLASELGLGNTNTRIFQRLQDHGVVYLKGVRSGDKTEKLFAVYDDVVLAEIPNNSNAKSHFASKYGKMSDKEIIEDLVELGGASKKLQSIWKVNTKEGKLNCANCAIAVEYTLSGKPTSALPWTYETIFRNGKKINKISYTRGTHYKILEKEFDNIFIKNISLNYLRKKLRNGQRGIVFAYNKNSTIGHFFNVINENGIVKFLDGQTGKAAKLNYDIYELLPTNFKKLE